MSKLMTRAMLLTALLGLIIASSSVVSVSALPTGVFYPAPVFDVIILDAKYCDIDGGGIENDILVILEFTLGYAAYYDFDYFITLTLPSGINFTYYVWIIAWAETIQVNNAFYNHATESGNYTVDVDALMYSPGSIRDFASTVFDPPGGSAGGDTEFGVY